VQALAKQFAEILQFVLRFDDLKMNNPAIQNDFSYYRRTLNRMKMNNAVRATNALPTPLCLSATTAQTLFRLTPAWPSASPTVWLLLLPFSPPHPGRR
jgi:hypothetical protein